MREMAERKVVFLNDVKLEQDVGAQWIGFYDLSGGCKKGKFLWWRNSHNELPENLRALCSMLWQHRIDARIGPPIDFQKTIAEKRVRLIQTNNDSLRGAGVYIREDHYVSFRPNLTKMGISF